MGSDNSIYVLLGNLLSMYAVNRNSITACCPEAGLAAEAAEAPCCASCCCSAGRGSCACSNGTGPGRSATSGRRRGS